MEIPVADNERLARFLLSSSHYSRENKRVKFAAFMPAADGATSVFRVDPLSDSEKWAIGQSVSQSSARSLYGSAEFTAHDVRNAQLEVWVSEPPPRHANIQGWPSEKSHQKMRAIELAQSAMLSLVS